MHPVYDEQGKIEHLVAEGVDISKQKQAFEDMLRQSRKAQMGEMISVIAHQWRQPLSLISAVTGNVTLEIELDRIDSKELRHSMDKINHTVLHLGETMTQFTNFFNPNKKSKETSFSVITQKSIDIIGSKLESEGVKISIDIDPEHKIQSFEEELIQVIMDMMKNSADFFKINNIKNAHIQLIQFIKEDKICLAIEDNAGGIKDENIDKIFDAHFSTKSEKSSTNLGLGLYVSKVIIENHFSGKLEVRSKGINSTFIIRLPL